MPYMSLITREAKIRHPNIDPKARYRSMPYQYMSGFSHRGIIIELITEMMVNNKIVNISNILVDRRNIINQVDISG